MCWLRSRRDRHFENAGVFSIMQNADVRRTRIFRGLVRDHAAGVIIFLEVYRVGRADYQPEPAAFRHSARDEKTGTEIAADNFARLDQLFLTNRLAVTQPPDIAPKRNAGPISQNFIKLSRNIGLRNTGGDPQRQLWTTEKRRFLRNRIAMINKPVLADAEGASLVESGGLFVIHVIHFFAAMSN